MEIIKNKNFVQIIPLGGLGEIGKNMCLFRYNDDIIVVDCGLMFPSDDMYGVDFVLPDMTYALENQDKIKGIIITHAHEDHIGGVSYFFKNLKNIPPIYGSKLTLGLLETRLNSKLKESISLNEVKPRDKVRVGYFEIEFLKVCHSIPDTLALAIQTPVGNIIYSSDFKFDPTPIDGQITDIYKLAEYGEKGVLLLMADSTNAIEKGYTPSEREVGVALKELFYKSYGKRIIVATFASNIHRIQQVFNTANEFGRKVAIIGRTIEYVVSKAINLGYLNCPENLLLRPSQVLEYDNSQLVLITTGSQGEPMSALNKMSNREHKYISIEPGDLVIISAHIIPGNERLVFKIINKLFACGAEVYYESNALTHVSGHASQEDLKLLFNLTKPKYFVPIHGENRHLIHNAELAVSVNIKPQNIIILENGDILEINEEQANIVGQVPNGIIMIDGEGIGYVGDKILKERKELSRDGIVFVSLIIDSKGKILFTPKVNSKGFILTGIENNIYEDGALFLKEILLNEWNKNSYLDILEVEKITTGVICEYFHKLTKRKPIILPIIHQLE